MSQHISPEEAREAVFEIEDAVMAGCEPVEARAKVLGFIAQCSPQPAAWRWRTRPRKGGEWSNWKLCTCAEYAEHGKDVIPHFESEFQPLCVASVATERR